MSVFQHLPGFGYAVLIFENLESLEDMVPSELEEVQKEMKYRNYQELHQQ